MYSYLLCFPLHSSLLFPPFFLFILSSNLASLDTGKPGTAHANTSLTTKIRRPEKRNKPKLGPKKSTRHKHFTEAQERKTVHKTKSKDHQSRPQSQPYTPYIKTLSPRFPTCLHLFNLDLFSFPKHIILLTFHCSSSLQPHIVESSMLTLTYTNIVT